MKTIFAKSAVSILSIIVIAALIVLYADFARKADRLQSASMSQSQQYPEIFGSSYCAAMNNLFATSGR